MNSFLFAQFIGLFIGFMTTETAVPLLATGRSLSVAQQFSRYLSLITHIHMWSQSDPFDKESKAFKSLKHVRRLHKKLMTTMNAKSGRTVGKDQLWVSQYSMSLAQNAFCNMVLLEPHYVGVHNITEEELQSWLHVLRVEFYCSGVDDRFNICSGNVQETRDLCRLYSKHHISNWLDLPQASQMSQMFAKAFFLRFNSLMVYLRPAIESPKQKYTLETTYEYFVYYMMTFLYYIGHLTATRVIMNAFMKNMLWLMAKYRKRISQFLNYMYPEIIDVEGLRVDLEYKDAFTILK